jgi:hypothetical protein
MTRRWPGAPGTSPVTPVADEAPKTYTGGMLALIPDNPGELVVDGGDPTEQIHLTLLYLGDNVTDWPAGQAQHLKELITASGPGLDAVTARIIGHAVLNPDGDADSDKQPCAVYLVGDTPDLDPLRKWATWVMATGEDYPDLPDQHTPVLWHVTAGYGIGIDALSYTGPVRFTTLRLALAGDVLDVPLGDQEAGMPEPQIKSITFTPPKAVRDAAEGLDGPYAQQVIEGKALDMSGLIWVAGACGPAGLSWAGDMMGRAEVKAAVHDMNMGRVTNDGPRLESIDDLHTAIEQHGNCPAEDRPARVRVLRGHAKRLGANAHTLSRIDTLDGATTDGSGTKSLPEGEVETKSWAPGNAAPPPLPHMAALHAAIKAHPKVRDSHKAKHKEHLAAEAIRLGAEPHVHSAIGYLEPHSFHGKSLEDGVEVKVTSPSPGAARLRNFWARTAEGRKKWRPGTPGDFKRLRRHLAKYVHTPRILNGLTANIHKLATGEWPGKKAHTARGNVGKPITYGVKSLVDWEWDGIEVKDLATTEPDMAAMFAGIDDWGQIFDEPWVEGYLAELAEAQGDTDEDTAPASEVERTAALAALGTKLVADPDPVVAEETEPDVEAPGDPDSDAADGGWGALFASAESVGE